MNKTFLCGLAGMVLGQIFLSQYANSAPIPSQSTPITATQSVRGVTNESEAKGVESEEARVQRLAAWWGLTIEDWKRVEMLQEGPRKYWSPNLDPLTLLGVEARSENERHRIALIQARVEFERAERELAYQRSYDSAFAELYGNVFPIDPNRIAAAKAKPNRLAVFVSDNCPACEAKVKKLQADKASFDVYMLGTQMSDAAIRNWAKRVGVDVKLVQSRQITLNHDAGTLKSIVGESALPRLPAVFIRAESSGLWVPEQ